jgi:hypothetical protein
MKTETQLTTAEAFKAWLAKAKPGDRCCYYVGLLAADASAEMSKLKPRARIALERLKEQTWEQASQGRVELTQRREGEQMCAYLATATSAQMRGAESQRVLEAA